MTTEINRDRLHVVLVSTRNPLNIGSAARAISNFGFQHLRLVNPYEPSFREARSAVGASGVLTEAKTFSSVAEAVSDCTLVVGTTAGRERDLKHPLRPLQRGSRLIRQEIANGRVAILFGSEKRGLANDDLNHCHWLMRIPTRDEHPAMNLGQSVAVCLYELARLEAVLSPNAKSKLATSGDLDRIEIALINSLQVSGYLKPGSAAATRDNIRRLLRRLHLESSDAELLLGMLRKIERKLGLIDRA